MLVVPVGISTERILEILGNEGIKATVGPNRVFVGDKEIVTTNPHDLLYGLMLAVDYIPIRKLIYESVKKGGV